MYSPRPGYMTGTTTLSNRHPEINELNEMLLLNNKEGGNKCKYQCFIDLKWHILYTYIKHKLSTRYVCVQEIVKIK